jgi:hypothetical protein
VLLMVDHVLVRVESRRVPWDHLKKTMSVLTSKSRLTSKFMPHLTVQQPNDEQNPHPVSFVQQVWMWWTTPTRNPGGWVEEPISLSCAVARTRWKSNAPTVSHGSISW